MFKLLLLYSTFELTQKNFFFSENNKNSVQKYFTILKVQTYIVELTKNKKNLIICERIVGVRALILVFRLCAFYYFSIVVGIELKYTKQNNIMRLQLFYNEEMLPRDRESVILQSARLAIRLGAVQRLLLLLYYFEKYNNNV